MDEKPSLMKRFFEQARKIMKQMGDGFEASNQAGHYPYTRQLPTPPPTKRKYPH